MAFIVEDGTGVPDANAYIDPAFMREFFESMGIVFTEEDAVMQTWIVQATAYIETVFGRRLIGFKKTLEQGLHFPAVRAVTRDGTLLADDVVPLSLMRACAQYARRARVGPLLPDPTLDASGYTVVMSKKKVGPIEKEFTVMGSGGPMLVRAYPEADMLLTSLLGYAGGGTRTTR